jgi:hypothetical protein
LSVAVERAEQLQAVHLVVAVVVGFSNRALISHQTLLWQ